MAPESPGAPLELNFEFSRDVCKPVVAESDAAPDEDRSQSTSSHARMDDGRLEQDLAAASQRATADDSAAPAAPSVSFAFSFSGYVAESQTCRISTLVTRARNPHRWFAADLFLAEFAAREALIASESELPTAPQETDDLAEALRSCSLAVPFAACYDDERTRALAKLYEECPWEPSPSESATSAEFESDRADRSATADRALRIVAGRMKPTEVEQLIARGFPTGDSAFWTNVDPRHRASAKGHVRIPWARYHRPVARLEHELAAIDGVAMRFEDEGGEHPIYR